MSKSSNLSHLLLKQVFLVPAGGFEAYQHYQDTIQRKRTISEIAPFVSEHDLKILEGIYHGSPFVVWGARNTQGNVRTFNQMNPGDYILFCRQRKITLIGEIAWKTTNVALAKHFWNTNAAGQTWENIYFIANERELDIRDEQLWSLLNYEPHFVPQGFMQIEMRRVLEVEDACGGFYDVILRLNQGLKINQKPEDLEKLKPVPPPTHEEDEKPSEHDEIQWRLIRLGHAARVDVWVPRSDQGKSWQGNRFRELVLDEFKAGLDIPRTVENIDTVWRFGYQIKAAFEVEHSTSIYSGLLRLSDLKTVAPNSLYPLYIVAPKERRDKVLSELSRPTFHDQLRLHEAARYISYDKVRELDEEVSRNSSSFRTETLEALSEGVS